MRTIRLKLSGEVSEFLETFCERYGISDLPFVEDVYALVRTQGNGLPDKARSEKMADFYSVELKLIPLIAKAMINKRVQVLKNMATTAMFQFHAAGKSSLDDMEFTESLLHSFAKMHRKLRQSQCLTCHLLTQCEFGKQYSEKVRDITIVIDPDYEKKMHQDCPHEVEIEYQNQIANAATFVNSLGTPQGAQTLQLANQQSVAPTAFSPIPAKQPILPAAAMLELLKWENEALKSQLEYDTDLTKFELEDNHDDSYVNNNAGKFGHRYGVRHVGGNPVYLDDKFIDNIKVTQLCIFQLALKLEAQLSKNKKGAFKPTEELTKDKKFTNIKSVNDVTKVVKRELADTDDVFMAKLRKKSLTKVQQIQQTGKRQLLYVLVDFSGSMLSYAGFSATLGFLNRAALAASFCIALSRRVCDDKGMIFARGFAGHTSELKTCKNEEQHRAFEQWVADSAFDGHSTRIYEALQVVYNDIKTHKGEISKSEILLITDAEDQFSAKQITEMRSWFEDIPLNVLDVVGGYGGQSAASASLEELADSYLKIDPRQNTVAGMVDLVGGKSKKKAKV